MKKRLLLLPALFTLATLAGCGIFASEKPEILLDKPPAVEEPLSLPESRRLEPISVPAIVTEGREPAEDYDLPPSLADPRYNAQGWIHGGVVGFLAEAPEADAAFYAAPYQPNGESPALVRWGDCLAEFDWNFLTPRAILPRMDCFDVDGDWEDELIVICYVGSGTGVSVEELHILEKGPDGTLTAYTFPENLWQEEVPKLFDAAELNGRTFAMLGHELVEIDGENLDLESASSGMIAGFHTEDWGGLQFQGAFALCRENSAAPCYAAETSAQVLYQNGIFAPQDFHLYSYYQ